MKNRRLWILTAFVVVCMDQLTKYWASIALAPYGSKPLLPVLHFTLAYNTGAAFSFLSGAGDWHRWFFTGFSTVMIVVLTVWLIRTPKTARLQWFALSLVLGGAVGNLIDRIRLGYVIDFIDVFYQTHHWPIFNVADSAICVGAFLLFVDAWKSKEQSACCSH